MPFSSIMCADATKVPQLLPQARAEARLKANAVAVTVDRKRVAAAPLPGLPAELRSGRSGGGLFCGSAQSLSCGQRAGSDQAQLRKQISPQK